MAQMLLDKKLDSYLNPEGVGTDFVNEEPLRPVHRTGLERCKDRAYRKGATSTGDDAGRIDTKQLIEDISH